MKLTMFFCLLICKITMLFILGTHLGTKGRKMSHLIATNIRVSRLEHAGGFITFGIQE